MSVVNRPAKIDEWLSWWLSEGGLLSVESERILNRYYESYRNNFSNYLRHYYGSQIDDALELVMQSVRPNILEVGCGCGTESIWFALNDAIVTGIDLSEERLQVARERAEVTKKLLDSDIGVKFIKSSVFDLESNNQFDMVWMEQAFHHIEPRKDLPKKLYDLLKPDGYVVISEANGWNPFLQAQLIKQRGFKTICEYSDDTGLIHIYGNERITTASKLVKLFKKSGFKEIKRRHFRVLPNFKGVDRYSWIERLIPNNLLPMYTHYNVVLKK